MPEPANSSRSTLEKIEWVIVLAAVIFAVAFGLLN